MEGQFSHKIDVEAYKALNDLPNNPFHNLVRQDESDLTEQRISFEKSGHCPLFRYPNAESFDVEKYLDTLKSLTEQLPSLCHGNAIVEDLYLAKVDELKHRALLVKAVQEKNDEEVTTLSENIFSAPAFTLKDLESELEEMLSKERKLFIAEKTIKREQFSTMTKKVLDHYNMGNWKIMSTESSSIKIKHGLSEGPGRILIPKNFSVSKKRAIELLTHEIEVHTLRTNNGRQSPLMLLGRGLDRYIATEEGLAILFQEKAVEKQKKHAPGFWNAYAIALSSEHNFAQVYEKLRIARVDIARRAGNPEPENKGRNAAWRLCVRTYRGIHNTGKKGLGYRRDHIYRSGLIRVKEAVNNKGEEILPLLFRGNIGLEHLERIKNLALPAADIPELIAKDVVKSFS